MCDNGYFRWGNRFMGWEQTSGLDEPLPPINVVLTEVGKIRIFRGDNDNVSLLQFASYDSLLDAQGAWKGFLEWKIM